MRWRVGKLGRMRRSLALIVALVAFTTSPSAAHAAFSLVEFDGEISNKDGSAATQAGVTPFQSSTKIVFPTKTNDEFLPVPDGQMKTIVVDLPNGFVGNPTATPFRCSEAQLNASPLIQGCPPSSQVGFVKLTNSLGLSLDVPVYNMATPEGTVALFAFNILGNTVHLRAALRPSDYGVQIRVENISQALPFVGSELTLWGVPADPRHNELRGSCLGLVGPTGSQCPTDAPEVSFLTNPTACTPPGVGLQTKIEANSWEEPGNVVHGSFFSHLAPPKQETDSGPTGCQSLPFRPGLSVTPTSHAAGAPTGLDVDLNLPQAQGPSVLGTAHLKSAEVVFPPGMTVNTATADGLAGCTETQIALHSSAAVACPESSRIGAVQIKSPMLEDALDGSVYVATQGTNPFKSLLAVYLTAEDPRTGILIKQPGKITPDSRTGRLTATFDETPQLPFESLKLRLKGGPRAPLVTPATCGTYTTHAELTSWARPNEPVGSDSTFTVDSDCDASSRFTPALEAGTTNPVAGAFSPFTLRLTRPDGQADVSSLEATLPEGLLARLAGVPLCGEAEAATGDCPAASQVGRVVVGAGAGSDPIYVPQPGKAPTGVYLAGPYEGAPYSLVVKVPAQAGPFDLGTVAVRNALHVDPVTSEVTAKSDPLPQILMGIPITYRDIRVEVDRPGFTLNPTSCDPMEVTSTIVAASGQSASPRSRFQAASCESLAFGPKLAISLKGRTRRAGHPALKATLTFPREGRLANIRRAQVGLPHSLFLDQGNLDNVCRQADLRAGTCPAGSIYGRARAWTPLLDRPLEGPVYLGVGYGHKLPDLVADLGGQIRILLNGKVDTTRRHGLRTTFEAVPDAPVSRFTLELKGGRKYGLIENSENLCREAQKASVQFTAHDGRTLHLAPTIARGCGKAERHRKGAGR